MFSTTSRPRRTSTTSTICRSTHTFPQRRFENAGEREFVLRGLAAAGIDPADKEESGWYLADFYLTRTAAEVAEAPVDELLGVSEILDF